MTRSSWSTYWTCFAWWPTSIQRTGLSWTYSQTSQHASFCLCLFIQMLLSVFRDGCNAFPVSTSGVTLLVGRQEDNSLIHQYQSLALGRLALHVLTL